jgi:tRNA A37 N6-isopentenylltransferase MiaA
MKKSILTLAVIALFIGVVFTNCNSPKQKVENAEQDLEDASAALDKANAEYLADIEKTRKDAIIKADENAKSLADFEARISKEKASAKADYNKRIAELNAKNTDLKKRIENYQSKGKDDWEKFKSDFNREMNDLLIELDNLNKVKI